MRHIRIYCIHICANMHTRHVYAYWANANYAYILVPIYLSCTANRFNNKVAKTNPFVIKTNTTGEKINLFAGLGWARVVKNCDLTLFNYHTHNPTLVPCWWNHLSQLGFLLKHIPFSTISRGRLNPAEMRNMLDQKLQLLLTLINFKLWGGSVE